MKRLKTLNDHNRERMDMFHDSPPTEARVPNGLECPQCDEELNDITGLMLASYPPKVPVECPNCGYTGSRL